MDLALLPSIILAIAEQRSLDAVLKTIIEGIARQPDVALARLWLLDPDASCPVCRKDASDGHVSLHLRASGGSPPAPGGRRSRPNRPLPRIPTDKPLQT